MINANKLKGKIVECGLSVEKMAKQLGVEASTVYRKMNGESEFTVGEVSKIAAILGLSDDDLTSIFFAS